MRHQTSIGMTLALVCVTVSLQATAAPRYGEGDYGTFGLPAAETWNFNQFISQFPIADNDDRYSTRFTAKENVTVDRIFQRFVGVQPGTTVNVSVIKDDGSGLPSSNPLDIVASANTTAVDGINPITFGTANLTAGTVYHVVTQGVTVPAPFHVFQNQVDQPIRPYDRGLDNKMSVLVRDADNGFFGDAWVPVALDPYFYFANASDTAVVGGPGQPYIFPSPTASFTQGGSGAKLGQRFQITDDEVPVGTKLIVKQITFKAIASDGDGGGMPNLIIRLRKDDLAGTILASTFMTQAQMNNTNQLLSLDTAAELEQGVSYLLTTEVGGAGGTASEIYFLTFHLGNAGSGPATWGGIVESVPVASPNNSWLSRTPTVTDWDLAFSFVALVPEPAGLAAAGFMLAGGLMLRRMRRW